MKKVTESLPLSSVDAATFDAAFLPGGHGVCFDLPNSEALQKQLSAAYTSGKVGWHCEKILVGILLESCEKTCDVQWWVTGFLDGLCDA